MPLHPKAAELLEQSKASGRPNAHLLPVAEARANFEADLASLGPGDPIASTRDVSIPVDGGEVPARAYRPRDGRLPVVVYFHGGGWLLGSVDSHEAACRALANESGAVVVSVGYRLSPEHKFPIGLEDCYAATRWVVAHADELDVDGDALAVAGDSAGANLAIAVGQLARERGGPAIRFQLLVYPVTTTDLALGFDPAYEGYFLYRDEIVWQHDHYVGSEEEKRSPLISPLDRADLSGLPPALVITAECDPLHAQGELFAKALEAAGVPVRHEHYAGMVHGFFQLPMLFEDGARSLASAGAALREALAGEEAAAS